MGPTTQLPLPRPARPRHAHARPRPERRSLSRARLAPNTHRGASMTHHLRRAITEVSPLHSIFVTALLGCFGSSEQVRRSATEVFRRGALPVVWASLRRQSTARISWLRLTSITHEAVERFLHEWPVSAPITIESMTATLDTCTCQTATRGPHLTAMIPVRAPLGILSLLEHQERMQLLQHVRAELMPDDLCVISAAIERERLGTLTEQAPDTAVARAVERMELLLLGTSEHTLSASSDLFDHPLAA